jgi:hypothetical protein
MLLTITTTHRVASDLGYLLHKHPDRCQSFDLSFGKVHVFYPEVGVERCTACLLLEVDAVGMIRGKNTHSSFVLAQYVNDRPYAASSFMSVSIAQVFGSALQGRCKDRPEFVHTPIPLSARIDVLPVRGGERFLRYLKFQPSLFREALARLAPEDEPLIVDEEERPADKTEDELETPLSLNDQRLGSVMAALRASGAKRVLDLGCGRERPTDPRFAHVPRQAA